MRSGVSSLLSVVPSCLEAVVGDRDSTDRDNLVCNLEQRLQVVDNSRREVVLVYRRLVGKVYWVALFLKVLPGWFRHSRQQCE